MGWGRKKLLEEGYISSLSPIFFNGATLLHTLLFLFLFYLSSEIKGATLGQTHLFYFCNCLDPCARFDIYLVILLLTISFGGLHIQISDDHLQLLQNSDDYLLIPFWTIFMDILLKGGFFCRCIIGLGT